jgi:hypothetical protein
MSDRNRSRPAVEAAVARDHILRPMPCALCGANAPLQNSHILPAFLFRWLRETSGTGGHIRNTKNPNIRVQDGLKVPMLCLACEGIFSSYETPFATNVFYPYDRDDGLRVGFDDWMLKFCVSVSWRVLRYARDGNHLGSMSAAQVVAADRALNVWSDFLQGRSKHPGEHEQHLLPFGPIDSHTMPDMPDNMNRYLLRSIDMDMAYGKRTMLTYAKLGPFALFGYVQPPTETWVGTRIPVRHGTIEPRKYELPRDVYEFIADRARRTREVYSAMSDKQIDKIDKSAMDNIDKLVNSKQLEAMMHDHRLFGENAIIRKTRKKGQENDSG